MGHGSNDAEGLEEASPSVRPSQGEKWSGIYELGVPAWDVPPTIAVSERAAEVAHGVKNAVHSLRGLATLLESRVSHCPRALEIVRGLHTAVDRLEELARGALEFPKDLKDGWDPGERRPAAEVDRLIALAADQVSTAFPAIQVKTRVDAATPRLTLSPGVLREALVNLLLNAAEAMQGRGVITVSATLLPGSLEIEVRDSGRGIAPGVMARLFHPGFTTKPRGNGLGLYLTRNALRAHGGNLIVGSREDDRTSFLITLPAGDTTVATGRQVEHDESLAASR